MKRFNKTAIAIALSGAMALGVAPTADAATPVTLQQGDLVYDKDGNLKTSFSGTDNGMATLEEGDVVYNSKSENVTEDRMGTTADLGDGTVEPNPLNEVGAKLGLSSESGLGDPDQIPTTIDKGYKIVGRDGEEKLVATEDGQQVVLEAGDKVIDPNGKDVSKDYGAKVLKADEKAALYGLAAAGTLITLGGIAYKVVNDAQGNPVLVPADRADQAPTAEDKAKSDQLVAEHGDEIAQQAAAGTDAEAGAASERGVNAETGNNAIAKGLVGLLLASVMGAAIFAFGRRRLV